jgi:ubiquinone/menaquinone biosynthesis C-methylase UbiE
MELNNSPCKCGFQYGLIDGNIYSFIKNIGTDEMRLSHEKWNELYHNKKMEDHQRNFQSYKNTYFEDTADQINKEKAILDSIYLEIGCGEFHFGNLIAHKVACIIGVDFSLSALRTAKKLLDQNKITNYILIHADINQLPLDDNQIDIIYGGGVIEHFESTVNVLSELYRVLKKDGISFNTVPYLNLASLTYRQVWGNIPDFPVIRNIFEFIHIKLLKSKHMIFGYEKSFTAGKLIMSHKKAGFKLIKVEQFKVKLIFEFMPSFLKGISSWLSQNTRLFWPMVKVIAKK